MREIGCQSGETGLVADKRLGHGTRVAEPRCQANPTSLRRDAEHGAANRCGKFARLKRVYALSNPPGISPIAEPACQHVTLRLAGPARPIAGIRHIGRPNHVVRGNSVGYKLSESHGLRIRRRCGAGITQGWQHRSGLLVRRQIGKPPAPGLTPAFRKLGRRMLESKVSHRGRIPYE
jgi:hypothetical protein